LTDPTPTPIPELISNTKLRVSISNKRRSNLFQRSARSNNSLNFDFLGAIYLQGSTETKIKLAVSTSDNR